LTRIGAVVLALGLSTRASAQPIRGVVLADSARTPIANAMVTAAGGAAISDRSGRFAIVVTRFPDTLVVRAVGWVPDTVALLARPLEPVVVTLRPTALVISDLIATADPRAALDLASHGRWQVPLQAARTVPPAVETDVYRALAPIPAVSFTSPLSARPLIRGYDAHEVVTRIDGFETINLFHLGRIFSSYPADATQEIGVTVAPYTSANGGAVAGIVDVLGRSGPAGETDGGAGFSFGSLSAFVGSGDDRARYFGALRFFHLGALDLVPGLEIPYHFEDFYGGLVLGPPERPRGRVTLFATRDRAGKTSRDLYLNWDNLVLGTRWRAVERARTTLELSASAARFHQAGEDVPGLRARGSADILNRFGRASASADLVVVGSRIRIAAGGSLGWRAIRNQIGETRPGSTGITPFQQTSLATGRAEVGGYLETTGRAGPAAVELAVRVDHAQPETSLQPRLHARIALDRRVELSMGLGRTSRLFHLLGEARSEPDFDFLDFWMSAGDSVPAARVDHATVDLNLDLKPLVARLSAYASEGTGLGEVRPDYDQQASPFEFFRFGRARTRGLEAQLGYRGGPGHPASFSLGYTRAISERDWGRGWVRWAQDRRDQLRAFGQMRWARLTAFGAAEAATGMPATAVQYEVTRAVPGVPGSIASPFGIYQAFGTENSVATSGTFRVDAGLSWTRGRPGGTRLVLGVAVINLLQTEVAPIQALVGEGRVAVDRGGRPTRYRRLFRLPGVPTVTARVEF
jgi:hypothetical protein